MTVNNAKVVLDKDFSSSATSITLPTWAGQIFWSSFPQIATYEYFDLNWNVINREILKITARSWDTLTIQRAVEKCPISDFVYTQTQTAVELKKGWIIETRITAEMIDWKASLSGATFTGKVNLVWNNDVLDLKWDLYSYIEWKKLDWTSRWYTWFYTDWTMFFKNSNNIWYFIKDWKITHTWFLWAQKIVDTSDESLMMAYDTSWSYEKHFFRNYKWTLYHYLTSAKYWSWNNIISYKNDLVNFWKVPVSFWINNEFLTTQQKIIGWSVLDNIWLTEWGDWWVVYTRLWRLQNNKMFMKTANFDWLDFDFKWKYNFTDWLKIEKSYNLPEWTDLNTITTWWFYDVLNAVNKPANWYAWGYVQIQRWSWWNNHLVQTYYDVWWADLRVFKRNLVAWSWKAWKEFTLT